MSSASLYPHLGLAVKRFAACLALGLALAPVWGQGNPLASLKGSIVYIREGNIWAFTPSTGERRQLTQDSGYRSPSMADDGTIGAVQGIAGRSHFVTIRPDGRKRAFPPEERIHLVHAELSPDGDLFAFAYVVVIPLGPNPARVGLTFSDRWAAAGVAGGSWGVFSSSYHHARWMTGERLILSGGGSYPYLVRGAKSGWEGESSPYRFEVPALRDETYDIARNGARFLVIGATYRVVGYEEQITGWHAIAYRPARPEEQAVYEFSLSVRTGKWAVNGIPGGNSAHGTVTPLQPSSRATYTAPAQVPSPNPVTVTADLTWEEKGLTKRFTSRITVEDALAQVHATGSFNRAGYPIQVGIIADVQDRFEADLWLSSEPGGSGSYVSNLQNTASTEANVRLEPGLEQGVCSFQLGGDYEHLTLGSGKFFGATLKDYYFELRGSEVVPPVTWYVRTDEGCVPYTYSGYSGEGGISFAVDLSRLQKPGDTYTFTDSGWEFRFERR